MTFTNDLGGADLPQMSMDATNVYNGVGAPTETEFEYNPGVTIGEQQVVTLYNTTGGTFTLSFGGQTTTALAWDATNSDVDTALEVLSTIGTVTVSGSAGGPYTITFTGGQAGFDLAAIKFDDTGLTNASYLQTISTQYNANGELEEASDPVANYAYTRDGLGRVTQEVLALAGYGSTITLDQAFNANSLRTQSEFAFGTTGVVTQDYVYDFANRLKETAQYDGASAGLMIWKRAQFTYSQNHLLEDIFRAQGSSGSPTIMFESNYDRDPADRVNSIMHHSWTWTIDLYDEYTFDAASRITSMMSAVDGFTQYTYDTTNQLIGANWATQADETYTYDENGNRTMAGYDTDPNNRLMSDGNYDYTYDLEGNRLTKTDVITGYVEENVWDHRNRLEAVIYKDDLNNVLAVVEMRYDYQNRLVRRTHDDDGPGVNDPVDRLFIYDAYQIVLQFDNANMTSDAGSGDLSHLFFWSTTTDFLLADETVDASPTSTDLLWAAPDHLCTVRDWVAYNSGTSTQFVANHRDFDSYGNMLSQTNVAYASSIGFTGRYFESITGYQFNLYRWYDPKVGRWLSEDPIAFIAGDSSLVRYAGNKPLSHRDPSGLAEDAPISVIFYDPDDIPYDEDRDDGALAPGLANGDDFRIAAALMNPTYRIPVRNIDQAIAALATIEAKLGKGKIDRLIFVDHSKKFKLDKFPHVTRVQQIGDTKMGPDQFKKFLPFLSRNARIYLLGCNLGDKKNEEYIKWIFNNSKIGAVISVQGLARYPTNIKDIKSPIICSGFSILTFDKEGVTLESIYKDLNIDPKDLAKFK